MDQSFQGRGSPITREMRSHSVLEYVSVITPTGHLPPFNPEESVLHGSNIAASQ